MESMFDIKAAVLLHDPPWKPWVIRGKHGGISPYDDMCAKGKPARREHESRHECDAAMFARDLGFPDPFTGWVERIVRGADAVASSFDRMLLRYRTIGFPRRLVFLNMFRPEKEASGLPQSPTRECIEGYRRELVELISGLEPRLRYHVFWSIYEPLWYKRCRDSVPPADTRIPTHTVFDHLYASATVANMIGRDGRLAPDKACLAIVDLAGVQRWIRASRKMRDLWASSWMASLLTWKAIEGLVEKHGPDIVVSPSLRMNWFYETWLITRLIEQGHRDKAEKLLELFREYSGYPGWPKHPVMPARAILIVPCTSPEELKKEITGAVEKAWKEIVDTVFSTEYGEIADEIIKYTYRELGGALDPGQVKRLLRENPGVPMRIIVERLDKAYKGYIGWVDEKGLRKHEPVSEQEHILFYHYLLAIHIPLIEARYKNIHIDPRGLHPIWGSSRMKNTDTGRRARFCSVCGVLPAVARIEEEKDYKTLFRMEPRDIARAASLVSRGESLCPYCLLKRLVSYTYGDIVKKLYGRGNKEAEELLEKMINENKVSIPSTTMLAGEPLAIEFVVNLGEKAQKTLRDICVTKKGYIGLLRRLIAAVSSISIDNMGYTPRLWRTIAETASGICGGDGDPHEIEDMLVDLVNIYLNIAYASPKDKRYIKEVINGLKKEEDLRDMKPILEALLTAINKRPHNTYILLRGDADHIGRVARGVIGRDLGSYIESVAEKLYEPTNNEVRIWITKASSIGKDLGEETVVVTPSYHAALSMALAAAAVSDIEVIEELGGVVVYAGGDDLLALLPPINPDGASSGEPVGVRAVLETRKGFWGLRRTPPWFHSRGGGAYPALAAYGRSYSVLAAHHKYPLSRALELSERLMDMAKEHLGTGRVADGGEACRGDVRRRDAAVYASTQTGAPAYIPHTLPGSGDGEAGRLHEKILILHRDIASGVYSMSIVYDLLSPDTRRLLEKSVVAGDPSVAEKLAEAVAARNSPRRKEGVLQDTDLLRTLVSTIVCGVGGGAIQGPGDRSGWRLLLEDFVQAYKNMRVPRYMGGGR